MVPYLTRIDLMYSLPRTGKNIESQLFHLDHEGITQIKHFIHLYDVGQREGPFTFIPADATSRIVRDVRELRRKQKSGQDIELRRYSDEEIAAVGGTGDIVTVTGPVGAGVAVDTSRCLHLGSRVDPGSFRLCLYTQYCTTHEITNVYDVDRFKNDPVKYLAVKDSVVPGRARATDYYDQMMGLSAARRLGYEISTSGDLLALDVAIHVLALLHQHVVLLEQTERARRLARRDVRREIVAQEERIHAGWLYGHESIALARAEARERRQRRAVVRRVIAVAVELRVVGNRHGSLGAEHRVVFEDDDARRAGRHRLPDPVVASIQIEAEQIHFARTAVARDQLVDVVARHPRSHGLHASESGGRPGSCASGDRRP